MKKIALLSALVGMMMCCAPAEATQFVFQATLNGANEAIPNALPGSGFITVTADDIDNSFLIVESWSGLSSLATGAHIHCCSAPDSSAPVVLSFLGFPGTESGSYTGMAFATSFADVLAGMQAGLAYADIHTAALPAGEIRGQLVSTAVPEASIWTMMVLGFGAIGATMRRRKYRLALR